MRIIAMPHHHAGSGKKNSRKGVVLLGVLVVIVLLSLSVYHYSDLAFAEYKSADQSQRQAQALALANSGVDYAKGILSNPTALTNVINSNPYNNPTAFSNIAVRADARSGYAGTFSLLAPPDPTDANGTIRFGVIDESGKINLHAFMNIDPTGQTLLNMLQQLSPNLTTQIAGAIVDWLDADDTPQTTGGAESDYYSTLNPPYYARNGNMDSLEELLLVQGVTPDLLFGQYRNPYFGLPIPGMAANPGAGGNNSAPMSNNSANSSSNNNNSNSSSGNNNSSSNNNNSNSSSGNNNSSSNTGVSSAIDLGWSGFLTIYSREQNVDLNGNPLVYLNDTDLTNLSSNLNTLGIDQTIINFIILYRQNGGSSSSSSSSSGSSASGSGSGSGSSGGTSSSGGSTSSSSSAATGNLAQVTLNLQQQGSNQINSLFDLISASVTVSGGGGNAAGGTSSATMTTNPTTGNTGTGSGSNTSVTYASPFSDQSMLQQYFPMLYLGTTLQKGTDIPARVNINTAPPEVLQALTAASQKGFNATDVQTILSTRPSYSAASAGQPIDPNFATPLWLITQANMSPSKLSAMDKYITTRSQVYRVHSVGTLDGQKLTARVEAVIDTNGGQPRILSWRNLTQLGKGVTSAQLQQAGAQK